MTFVIYYYREHRCWYGYWATNEGDQLCDCLTDINKEQLLIQLGQIKDATKAKYQRMLDEGNK
jgi:hypothetical protein